jgi:hypothetical protein
MQFLFCHAAGAVETPDQTFIRLPKLFREVDATTALRLVEKKLKIEGRMPHDEKMYLASEAHAQNVRAYLEV